uniref:Cysteine-rich repeat secretory protein 61 n=1 Tax=Cajanus cajan TaxID=3821 RepID=A0A151QUB4_CAJCA|nr:Putative cysteine-rich repeat secretory protein 61 [Cajanus cajan]
MLLGEVKLENSTTLYGMTQCTRDLSNTNCTKCLDDALSKLLDCCDGNQGGRVLKGSCNFRYEIFPFLND